MKALFQNSNPKRQKLIHTSDKLQTDGGIPTITTVQSLRDHLQLAIELELSTIPPYLCALYSIKEGTNPVATNIIKSVVVEEMLHMSMAANLLNAVGGAPVINSPASVPKYPSFLPQSDESFKVRLLQFSKEAIGIFLKIERPAATAQPPQADHYHTIGQFYQAIRLGFIYLAGQAGNNIFTGDPKRQILPEYYYGGGGGLIAVTSLADALQCIDEIEGQGEGIDGTILDPDHQLFGEGIEYAHYFKFNEIYYEQLYQQSDSPQSPPSGQKIAVDWGAVYNMKPDPSLADYEKGSELWNKATEFNKTYKALLDNLHKACNGQPDQIMEGVVWMYRLKYLAVELMKTPLANSEFTAGPTFEFPGD
jgi:ferritin-like protein